MEDEDRDLDDEEIELMIDIDMVGILFCRTNLYFCMYHVCFFS